MVSSFQLTFPAPNPRLTPNDVIRIQLDALQNNDLSQDHAGLRAAFAFASPQARSMTRTIGDFYRLIRSPLYDGLIGFERAEVLAIKHRRRSAQVDVCVHMARTGTCRFLFTLSRQKSGSNRGCWMIDGVLPMG